MKEYDEKDLNRALAGEMTAFFKTTQGNLVSISIDMAKWIQTSLMAINGAATIATIPLQISNQYKTIACGLFVTGVVLALFCGYLQLKALTVFYKPIGEQIGYWISVTVDGERVPELENHADLATLEKRATKWVKICG